MQASRTARITSDQMITFRRAWRSTRRPAMSPAIPAGTMRTNAAAPTADAPPARYAYTARATMKPQAPTCEMPHATWTRRRSAVPSAEAAARHMSPSTPGVEHLPRAATTHPQPRDPLGHVAGQTQLPRGADRDQERSDKGRQVDDLAANGCGCALIRRTSAANFLRVARGPPAEHAHASPGRGLATPQTSIKTQLNQLDARQRDSHLRVSCIRADDRQGVDL